MPRNATPSCQTVHHNTPLPWRSQQQSASVVQQRNRSAAAYSITQPMAASLPRAGDGTSPTPQATRPKSQGSPRCVWHRSCMHAMRRSFDAFETKLHRLQETQTTNQLDMFTKKLFLLIFYFCSGCPSTVR